MTVEEIFARIDKIVEHNRREIDMVALTRNRQYEMLRELRDEIRDRLSSPAKDNGPVV